MSHHCKSPVVFFLSATSVTQEGGEAELLGRPWMGSYHFAEIPLVMGTYSNYRGQSTAFETQLSETMQDLWLTFAKNPKDGLIAKGWPAVVVNGSAMTLGVDGVVTSTQRISVIDAECSSL